MEKAKKKPDPIYDGWFHAYIQEVIPTEKDHRVCVYLPDCKVAVITKMHNIEIHPQFVPIPHADDEVQYVLHDKRSVEQWARDYYSGKGRLHRIVRFKFYAGDDEHGLRNIERVKESFDKFFKTEMQYQLVDRVAEIHHLDGTIENKIVKDAVVEVDSGFEAFRNWFWKDRNFEGVVVLEPNNWNDRLLADVVERFAARLTKYGKYKNYTLSEELKPDYVQEMKEREQRYQEWLAGRDERIKARRAQKEAEEKSA